MNSTKVIANDPEALLAFTVYTVKNLIQYTNATSSGVYGCALKRPLPPLPHFIRDLYTKKSNKANNSNNSNYLTSSVKLFALIYLYRLKSKLPKNARGGPDTPYRLILAALLTSSKYLSETGTGLSSMHLSQLIQFLFTAKDINQMERSFLGLLKYDLWVSTTDVQSFMHLYGPTLHIDVCPVDLLPPITAAAATATATSIVSKATAASTSSTTIVYGRTNNQAVILDTSATTTTNTNTTSTISPHPA